MHFLYTSHAFHLYILRLFNRHHKLHMSVLNISFYPPRIRALQSHLFYDGTNRTVMTNTAVHFCMFQAKVGIVKNSCYELKSEQHDPTITDMKFSSVLRLTDQHQPTTRVAYWNKAVEKFIGAYSQHLTIKTPCLVMMR